jgi:probable poly-beta-1,6-N-acetyl-D-glucosamine export protein
MSSKREHIYEIHYIRAIASLMVLLVHVSAAYFYQHGQKYNDYTFFINQISRFGTPMFAMMSGFLLFYQTRKKGFNFKRFLSSRFTKIGVPFLVWSSFYFLFMYFVLKINPMKDGIDTFLLNFFSGNAFYHLYFIAIVFQFYLIFPLLQVIRSKMLWSLLLILAAVINLYFLEVDVSSQFDGTLGVILSQRAFLPEWIFFFIFGGFLAYHWEPLLAFSKKYKIVLSVAAVIVTVLAVMEYKSVGSIPSNRAANFINIPILTLFMAGIMDDIKKIRLAEKFLKEIGSLSMAIYLIHPFVINIFERIVPAILWKTSLFPITFGLILLTTIMITKLIQLLPFSTYILTVPKLKGSNGGPKSKQRFNKEPFVTLAKNQ